MAPKEQEYQVGDEVRFRAYLYQPVEGLKATVKSVSRYNSRGEKDGNIFYEISGEAVSITSPNSLVGSKYYLRPAE